MQDAAGFSAALLQIMHIAATQMQDAITVAAQPFEISHQRVACFWELQEKMIGKLRLQLLALRGAGHGRDALRQMVCAVVKHTINKA